MILASALTRKTLVRASLMWFCSLFLYSFPSLATIHSVISPKPKLHNQQEDRLKCGYMHKGITLNLPVGLLLSKKAKGEGNRVEPDVPNRCSGYRPDILLTALIPQSNIGITVAEYPTFFFYIPDANLGISQGEFVLRNENDEEIYKKTVKLKATDSIVTIDLSSSPSFPPLEVGKSYSWGFSIIFDERDRSADSYVFGWIKRVEPNSEFQHKLATALPQEKPGIYATNGIWYEALASLATLRCTSPNNSTLTSDWESLLQQVGLPEISKKPLAQCAEAKAL